MTRAANETSKFLADLKGRLADLVEAARADGRAQALSEIRSLVGGGVAAPVTRGPGRPKGSNNAPKAAAPAPKPKKKRKNSWAGLSPEARLARVNAIRKGKGLPPKTL